MNHANAQSAQEYLDALPQDRREALQVVRQSILDNLPDGYQEIVDFGMIAYVIPLETYPKPITAIR